MRIQTADNDYAVGRIVEKVAKSKRYSGNTLVFVVEDDSQDGPDHVDAHRSIAFVAGPYVKQGAVVSTKYTTVSMIATIVDILGIEHLGTYDALDRPMTDAFSKQAKKWDFNSIVPDILRGTQLPLPVATAKNTLKKNALSAFYAKPSHDASYWAAKTEGFDFNREDRVDAAKYNLIQWQGCWAKAFPIQLCVTAGTWARTAKRCSSSGVNRESWPSRKVLPLLKKTPRWAAATNRSPL